MIDAIRHSLAIIFVLIFSFISGLVEYDHYGGFSFSDNGAFRFNAGFFEFIGLYTFCYYLGVSVEVTILAILKRQKERLEEHNNFDKHS